MADAEGAPLVIVKGMAGTAKTFYTLAVGLHAMLEQEGTGLPAHFDQPPQRPV